VLRRAGRLDENRLTHNEPQEANMTDSRFLTPEEVVDRYRGGVSLGTLRNWRTKRIGPSFIKIGKAVLYPVEELEDLDKRNRVPCSASERLIESARDRA
jgi:hypothetical protein